MNIFRRTLASLAFIAISACAIPEANAVSYNLAWVRQFDESSAHSVVDYDGRVAVGTNSTLRAYDASGGLLSVLPIQVPVDRLAIDAHGNIFACGKSFDDLVLPNAGQYDAIFSKLDPDGNLVWMRQWGTGHADGCRDVFVEMSGNIVVSGYEGTSTFVRKLDSAGNQLWARYPAGARDGNGVAADASGNVVVVGYGNVPGSPNPGGQNANVSKLSPTGQLVWQRALGSDEYDTAEAVVIDAAGNIYVTGETQGQMGASFGGRYDVFLAKLDPNGNSVWTAQLGVGHAGYDYGRDITIGPDGDIYIVGDGTSAAGTHLRILRYSPDGELVATNTVRTSASEFGYGIDVDARGNVYVSGRTTGNFGGIAPNGPDGFVAKFVPIPEPSGWAIAASALCTASLAARRRRNQGVDESPT